MHNLKILGLAIVAVLAMSALSASMASAAEFNAEKTPVTITGAQVEENVLTTTAGTVKCTGTKFVGTSSTSPTTTITVNATYTGCTGFGFPATVSMNGCHFTLHISPGVATGTADVLCSGNEITVVASSGGTTKCTVHVKAQNGLGTITYTNAGAASGSTREVLLDLNLSKIHYTHTEGTGLGKCAVRYSRNRNAQRHRARYRRGRQSRRCGSRWHLHCIAVQVSCRDFGERAGTWLPALSSISTASCPTA